MGNWGLGGERQHLISVQHSSVNPDHPVNRAALQGSPGEYRVVFVLQRLGYAIYPEHEFTFEAPGVKGDSYLAIRPPALTGTIAESIQIETTTDAGQFIYTATANDAGFIGQITTVIAAESFQDAERKAYRVLAPTLSHWSTYFDTPVVVARIEIKELRYESRRMLIVSPHDVTPFVITPGLPPTVELRTFESYYREGINSNSPPYQFLCYAKILEGVRANRVRVARARKRSGLSDQAPQRRLEERVPENPTHWSPWLDALFPQRSRPWDGMALDSIFLSETRGRTVEELLAEPERGAAAGPIRQLRDDIAHSLWQSGLPTLVADEELHLHRVIRWLPVTKCIARLLLINDFGGQLWSGRAPDDDEHAHQFRLATVSRARSVRFTSP